MIPLFKVNMPVSVDAPLLETLHSGFIGQGKKVEEFERGLTEFLNNPYVLTLNSGTSAIHLALRLANVGPGDEVICSPMTCTASIQPILERGAQVVWADIDPGTGNIDSDSVMSQVTAKTKAVIPVHWGGYPCDLDDLNDIATGFDLKVIEDAAHAFGAKYRGCSIGSISPFTCFSFQAIKHFTTVDGGCLVCLNEDDYKRGKLLRWYGIDRDQPKKDMRCEEDIKEYGYKYHMNDISATIGIEQLKQVRSVLTDHRINAYYYDSEFETRHIRHAKPLNYDDANLSSYWLYTILVDDRPSFMEWMTQKGIQVSRVHARNDRHTCFKDARNKELPGVDEFDKKHVCIPVGWWLTIEDREYIVDCIERWDMGQ